MAAVCSLTLTVATRYCVSPVSAAVAGHSAKIRIAEPKVQHLVLDRDDARALPPAGTLAILPIATYQERTAVLRFPVPIAGFEDAVSNRAPPSATRLS